MNPQDFYKQAKQAGYDDATIQGYMRDNGYNGDGSPVDISGNSAPQNIPINTGPSVPVTNAVQNYMQSKTQPQTQPQTPPNNTFTNLVQQGGLTPMTPTTKTAPTKSAPKKPSGLIGTIEDWAPTAAGVVGSIGGNILLPGIGGSAGAGVLSGATQAGVDLLQGKGLGDTVKDSLATGGLNAATEGLGGLAAKGIGKVAIKAGEKLMPKIGTGTFAKAVPSNWNYGPALQQMGDFANRYGLSNLPITQAVMKMPQVMKGISDQIVGKIAAAAPVAKTAILDNINKYTGGDATYLTQEPYQKALQDITNRVNSLGGKSATSTFVDSAGRPLASADGGAAPATDIYSLKQQLGNELQSAFKQDAKGNTLTPQNEVKMMAWNALKDTIDGLTDATGQPIQGIRDLNTDQHLLYAAAPAIVKAAQTAGKSNGGIFGDFLAGQGGNAVVQSLTKIPLIGWGLGYGAKKLVEGPESLVQGGEKIAGKIGQTVGGAAGALAGGLAKNLLPSIDNTNGNAPGNGQEASNNNHENILAQNPSLSNYGPSTDGYYHPKTLSVATVAPQWISDTDYAKMIQQPPYNIPGTPQRQNLDTTYALGKQQAQTYVSGHKIPPAAVDWMQNAPTTFNTLNTAIALMNKVPPSVLNRVDSIDELNKVTNGQYDALAAVSQILASEVGKLQQGGILRELDFKNLSSLMPSTGDSPTEYAAKIDTLGKFFASKYQDYYLPYTLQAGQAPPGVQSQTVQQAQQPGSAFEGPSTNGFTSTNAAPNGLMPSYGQ